MPSELFSDTSAVISRAMLHSVLGEPFNPPPETMPHARAVYLGFVDKATRQPDGRSAAQWLVGGFPPEIYDLERATFATRMEYQGRRDELRRLARKELKNAGKMGGRIDAGRRPAGIRVNIGVFLSGGFGAGFQSDVGLDFISDFLDGH